MNKPHTNRHHIVPQSHNGSNIHHNIVIMNEKAHEAFHKLFANALPHEQLEILLQLNITAFREQFAEEIQELLERDLHRMYKPSVFKRDSEIQSQAGMLYFETLVGRIDAVKTTSEQIKLASELSKLHADELLTDNEYNELMQLLLGS